MADKRRITRITLDRAITGHKLWCMACNYTQNTLNDYNNTFQFFAAYVGEDAVLDDITKLQIEEFMSMMGSAPISSYIGATAGYAPSAPPTRMRSRKTLVNYLIALKSLWHWAYDNNYVTEMVPHRVKVPRAPEPPIEPLTPHEVKLLLKACEKTTWAARPEVTQRRPTAVRDQALVALMVETGLRASEVCDLTIADVDFTACTVRVREGKGRKHRIAPFERKCAHYLRTWLVQRPAIDDGGPDRPFFVNMGSNSQQPKMTRTGLGRHLQLIGKRAKLNVTPQILRTTAACLMAQNGMSALAIKRILGHARISTTMRYVEAARIDVRAAMKESSPLSRL